MIFKSYLVENDLSLLKDKNIILLYGENTGLKDDLKRNIIENNINREIIKLNQDDILKNNFLLDNEIMNSRYLITKK